MFDFIFRKKPTIFLLLGIIVISLLFSILLNQPLHEGLEFGGETINNPTPEDIEKINKIIENKDMNDLQKLSNINDILKGKYKILGEIYRQNASSLLKELNESLNALPKRDGDGKLFDTNALVGDKRDMAKKLLASNDYSAMEKINKISVIAEKDKIIKNIIDEYIKGWLRMVKNNIEQLKSTINTDMWGNR